MKTLILFGIAYYGTALLAGGQHQIASIPNSRAIRGVLAQQVGDSLYFSYYAGVEPEKQFGFWILPNGTVKEILMKLLVDKPVCGIVASRNGNKLFYFIEKDNATVALKAVQVESVTDKQALLRGQFVPPGRLIGVSSEGEALLVYTFERKKLALTVTKLNGMEVVGERVYNLGVDLGKLKASETTLIPDGKIPDPGEAAAKLKIFPKHDAIYIVIDHTEAWEGEVRRSHGTKLIRLDKTTGERSILLFEEPGDADFSSYLCGDYLFRNHGLSISVFSLKDGKAQPAINPLFQKHLTDRSVYVRKGSNNRMWCRGANVYTKDHGRKYVIAYQDSIDNYVLMVGSTAPTPPGGFMPVNGISPLVTLVTATAAMVQRLDTEATEISAYFYLTGNPTSGFDFNLHPKGLHYQEVDNFEVKKTFDKIDYRFKGYLKSKDKIIGFYMKTRIGEISVLEF